VPIPKLHLIIGLIWLAVAARPINAQVENAGRTSRETRSIQLFTAPDASSPLAALVARGENLSPLAESLNAGGDKWYLVKTKNGTTGWIKASDAEGSEKMDKFFKSLSAERSLSLSTNPAPAVTNSHSVVVPIFMNGSAVVVSVMLNRAVQTQMILDTGATFTVLTSQVATSLGLQSGSRASFSTANGVISSALAQLGSLKVGDAEALNLTVAIQDISPKFRIGGLLGLDFLSRYHTSIDSRRQLLTLAPR
jgi:clan AA aspartic protease (TIGR02281 family)